MRCAKCGIENPVGKKFCGDCGAALANLCSKCGADNPTGKRFCGECGTALNVAKSSATRASEALIQVAETSAAESLKGVV